MDVTPRRRRGRGRGQDVMSRWAGSHRPRWSTYVVLLPMELQGVPQLSQLTLQVRHLLLLLRQPEATTNQAALLHSHSSRLSQSPSLHVACDFTHAVSSSGLGTAALVCYFRERDETRLKLGQNDNFIVMSLVNELIQT